MNWKFLGILLAVSLSSCGGESNKKVAVFEEYIDSSESSDFDDYEDYDNNDYEYDTEDSNDLIDNQASPDVISVPFKTTNGVKTVKVTINDAIGVDMIIDTGCSGVLISLAEAKYLAEKGTLTREDILGTGKSVIADGSIVTNSIVRLDKLTIGDGLTAHNVMATVSENIEAPLLLGNEVFDRVKSISIDNENKQILFHLK